METVKLLEKLPITGSGCGSMRITANSVDLSLEYEYSDESNDDLVGEINFISLVAFRFKDELHNEGFPSESYDAIAEIENSEWIKDIADTEPSGLRVSVSELHHFVVFLSSNGYLEVIAEELKLERPRSGLLN